MMNSFLKKASTLCLCMLSVCGVSQLNAQQLSFKPDGTFKIVQFTDVHYCLSKPESKEALQVINEVLDSEKPDLVVFTGDVVTEAPAKKGWDVVTEPLIKRGIPFAVTLGNHDDEQDLSRAEVAKLVASYPHSLFKDTTADVSGYGNYTIAIQGAKNKKVEAVLYCMDSRSYSKLKQVEGYGWFAQDQVSWYSNQSKTYTLQNGGKPLPALAFFHIALPEYNKAYNTRAIGLRFEDECNPKVNSGMFTAMLEAGDVMGTFVGHDHDNDYIAWLNGIALVYGRFTGGKTTYINIENGARVITLKEGESSFKSWIHLKGDRIIQQTEFPKSFIKK